MEETVRITSAHVVEQMMKFVNFKDGGSLLEPSAGYGDLLDHIIFGNYIKYPQSVTDCVELNARRREVLRSKGYNIVGSNFLEFETAKLYDYVIAAPNSVNSIDVEHVIRMFRFTKNGGTIVSLMDPIWMIGEDNIHKKFREWVKDKNYKIVMLEDYSFIEKFKTRPTIIIIINK
jgi:hypothetical protein